MMQSSTKSPTITVFRFRSDRTMFGSYIPLAGLGRVAGCEEDRSFKPHATTNNSTTITTVNGTASGAQGTEVAITNKSDYIYLTQSTDSRALLVTRFPLDDLGASRALVGHITELMRTTNSVTLKCDLNAYLSNVSISRNLALDQCTTLNRNVPTVAAVRGNRCDGSYIRFDDLLAMVAGEKALLKRRSALESQGRVLPRLRLCGGGEDSINNGTSAWGTPPTSANGTSAWGIPNQQQQQQQPPQAWGGTASSNNANNNNNNNNNNQPTSSQSQRQSSQSQDHNANKAPQQQGGGSAPSGGGTPNPWNRNPTQQQPPQQQPQPGPNPNQQQPPQQPQLVMANNGNVATKSQLEQLSHLREALFSQDGWGCQNVNQDTNWEVPGSPEPPKPEVSGAAGGGNGGPNPQAVTGWKPCNLNNGTELWEANLRNGGQPPPPQAPVQKTPWGPASNIGGTWGEDDDSGEANVWNGAAGGNPPAAAPPAWGQNNPQMWPPGAPTGPNPAAVKKDNDWAGVGVIGNTGAAAVPPAVPGWDSRGAPVPAVNVPPGPIGQNNPIEAVREIRGDPRGISGRLNGNVGMWDQPNVPNLPTGAKLAQGSLPSVGGGGNSQWNTPVPNKLPGGWDDSPSPMNNRPTLDDGPGGLWNQGQLSRQNSNVSSWKDMSDNVVRTPMPRTPLGGGANLPLGPAVSRGVRLGGMNPGMKPDSSMWGQNQGLPMNGSWDDCAGAGGINNWDDKGIGAASGNGPWNDYGQSNLWKQQGKPSVGGWPDPGDLMGGGSGSEWNMNKPPSKMSPVEFIRSSKQYRMLCENGFKKEDVELVLRTTNMNFDESLEILQRHNSAGDWRGRPDEHPGSAFDAPFSNRFPAGSGGGMPFSQNQNLLNNVPGVGGPNPNLAALNNLKYLSQGGGGAGGHSSFGSQPGGGGGPNPLAAAAGAQQNPQAQPSTQHLRMLVQQIQMAVHAGFLNHQILNQPLAPQTLLLLNQLLTNIRQMQHIQNNLARSGGATGVSTVQLTMQINKHKSTISQLQQQIATQQAIYVKQQQQQQQPGGPHQQPPNVGGLGGAADFLRQQDLVSLQNNFADMSMGKEPVTPTGGFPASAAGGNGGGAGAGVTSQQSRLNQWKLPSLEKDGCGANDLTDFSRAPGTTAKSTLSTASSNIGSLGLQDGTWSSGRSNLADGWPDQPTGAGGDPDNKDWNPSQDNAAFSDLVPEFEPGKPWKGAQLKIDEDPSITPGSVARSPLSIATAKEADLFGGGAGKVSPSDSMGLGSSTWGKPAKNVWPDSITSTGAGGGGGGGSSSDLWGTPMGKTTRGPPPGLGANKNANGWASGAAGGAQRSGSGGNWPSGNGWGSSWLLLKNLTSQIDGATLRTLCMQHGPLQSLQLYPNHGLALCKYSSREEASKAQQALNNCPLGSTNIGAECPSEADVQTYLQQLGVPAVGGGGGSILPPSSSGPVTSVAQSWRQAPRTTGADTWGSGWPPSSGAGATGGSSGGLWAPLEGTTANTPSNLNSFLPESLLGTDLN